MSESSVSSGGLLSQTPLRGEIAPRVLWLIYLRYLAVVGVALVLFVVAYFPVQIELQAQILLLASLLISNMTYHFFYMRIRNLSDKIDNWVRLALIQISIDFLILTLQLHYGGGIENPFFIYYVFHTAFAGLLLTPRSAAMAAAWGAFLYSGMVLGEGLGLFNHYSLSGWIPPDLYKNPWAMAAAVLPIATCMFFMTYLNSSIGQTIGDEEKRRTALQESLRRRGDELAEAYRRLENAMKEREQFLVTVEHEMKSPLAAIRSNLEAILVAGGDLSPLVKDMIDRSSKRTQSMLELVQDLLALSRMEHEIDTGVIQEYDIAALVKDEVELIRPLAEEKGLQLTADLPGPITAYGSANAARYCAANLLSNAVRYTQRGWVNVTLQQEGETVELHVQDTGIGIAAYEQQKIFQEFYRTQSARETVPEGTGVGMTLVKRCVEALDGTITLDSKVGQGSTFTVRLPIRPSYVKKRLGEDTSSLHTDSSETG